MLSAHYRQPLDWTPALVEQSVRTLDRLYGTLRDLADVEADAGIPQSIEDVLDDDLNTPQALAELARIAGDARKAEGTDARREAKSALLGAGLALGLLQQPPADVVRARRVRTTTTRASRRLIDERVAAKAAKDFARADAIRKQLADDGILLEDTPQGVRWKRA